MYILISYIKNKMKILIKKCTLHFCQSYIEITNTMQPQNSEYVKLRI